MRGERSLGGKGRENQDETKMGEGKKEGVGGVGNA